MSKLSYKKKKEIAERYYVHDGYTGRRISEILDVSETTVSKWKTEGKNWDEKRANLLSSPHKIRELLIEQLKKVAQGEDSTINADSLAKIAKVLDSVSGKTSTQVVISVFQEFDNWMATQDAEMAIAFLKWHKDFIMHKASQE